MGWSEDLAALPPIVSVRGAAECLDRVLGKGWLMDVGFMSPQYHWAQISLPEEGVTRKGWSAQGPDQAFLEAYAMLGGRVGETAAKPAPRAAQRPQPPKKASAPIPTAWKEDAYPDVAPLPIPDFPSEPDWFSSEIGGLLKKKHEGVTWKEAIQAELENPGARDSALGMVRWAIGRPATDVKFAKHSKAFSAKAKAALIWFSQAEQSMPNYDEDQGGYVEEPTPF